MDNRIVQELIKDRYSETFKNFMLLFETTLQATREKMDSAGADDFRKLQGTALVLKDLLNIQTQKTTIQIHDGGFD